MQFEIELTITGDNSVDVLHKITNIGAWDVEISAWALSVMAQGGLEVVPQPEKDTYLLANRWLALWEYSKMNDSRVYWGDKYITLKQDPNAKGKFKFGINSEHGWAAYFNRGNMFVKHFPAGGTNYPDGGMSYETFTNKSILELESLSELKVVTPGDCVAQTETWKLFKDVEKPAADNEAEIAAVVEKYLI